MKSRVLGVLLPILAAQLCSSQGYWSHIGEMPESRYAHTVDALNGKIYVVGGVNYENAVHPRTALVCDTSDGTWRTIPLYNGSIRAAHGSCVIGGKLYVVGGNDSSRTISTMDMYDPVSGTWVPQPPMHTDRGLAACVALGGKIYVFGGMQFIGNPFADLSGLSTVEVYDTTTRAWTDMADMPAPRWGHSAVAVDGKIYVFGGRAGTTVYSSVAIYSPQTNKWASGASMPTRRYCLTACLLDSTVYTIGGWLNSGAGPLYDKVEVYHPGGDSFSAEVPLPVARATLPGLVLNNRIYVYGGTRTTHPLVGTAEIFEFDRSPWFARNVEVTRQGRDTLRITARALHQQGNMLKVTAILADGAGTLIDSVSLSDDGLHGDGAPTDGLWGCRYIPIRDDSLHVSLRTEDEANGRSRTLRDVTTYIFTRGAIISVDTRTLDLRQISVSAARVDTTFLVCNIGYAADSLTVTVDPGNVVPDTAVSAFPGLFALAPGDSARMKFSVRPGLLPVGYYSAEVQIKSRSVFGQTVFRKSFLFEVIEDVEGSTSDIAGAPTEWSLSQNYPNPFNSSTMIRYGLPERSHVSLEVYNALGQSVAKLVSAEIEAGYHEVRFDASGLPSGVYLCRLQAGGYLKTMKLLALR